ncbi:MAG: hypothetical protein GY696_26495 [Gammaproteobacteria bacterium]|nr:hypothetical protein [Gammaproteobacteria bacterium]
MEPGTRRGDPSPPQGGRKKKPRGEERDQPNFQNIASRGQEGGQAPARAHMGRLTWFTG